MEIGVIGAGNVGTALGENWQSRGYNVRYGVVDPADAKYARLGAGRVIAVKDVAAAVDVIVLATPWQAMRAVCAALGPVAGKIIIDCTNPLKMGSGGLELACGFTTSGGEQVQSWCDGAAVFKTLNQVGFETMADPSRQSRQPVMFVAGDDAAGKPTVIRLVAALGFEAIDAGPLKNARLIEAYAMLWIDLAFNRGLGRDFAFAITRPATA